jgi:hypothetical protein
VRKDDHLRSQAAELSDFDGGELAAKIVEAGERIVEHDNRVLQCRIRGDLREKKRQRESKLVPAAQRVPEAGLVKRLGGAAGRNWYVVDKNLVAGCGFLAPVIRFAVIDPKTSIQAPAGLVEMIKEAFAIRNQLLSGSHDSIEAMSGRLGMNKGRLTSLVRLSYLGPEIVRALLAGSQSNALTSSRLLRLSKDLPHDWKEQRCFLGFRAASRRRFSTARAGDGQHLQH